MQHLIRISALAITIAVTGCATSSSVDILQEGPTVQAVYSKGTSALGNGSSATSTKSSFERAKHDLRSVSIYQPNVEGWTRDSRTEINGLFPKLPNPVITMYVYPHMATSEALPVPGYATQINLYESDQFALPNELPRTHHDARYKKMVVNGKVREL